MGEASGRNGGARLGLTVVVREHVAGPAKVHCSLDEVLADACMLRM